MKDSIIMAVSAVVHTAVRDNLHRKHNFLILEQVAIWCFGRCYNSSMMPMSTKMYTYIYS